jgi:hypothetical protein
MFSMKAGLTALGISTFFFMAFLGEAAAHDPIPDWDDCPASATSTDSRFAPLPTFVQGTIGSAVTAWPPVGSYDFCAYMDTVYCQFMPIAGIMPEIEDIAVLARCIDGDINGPLDAEADVPVTPNGIPDGQYELGILTAVLNDPTHPLHEDALAAVQNNFVYFKNLIQSSLNAEGYLGILPLLAPYLIGSMSMTMAGYATMGDTATYDAIDALLVLYEFLGTIDELDSAANTIPVSETGPDEDIDGDSFTNREEYDFLVPGFGYTGEEYVAAALDPGQPGLLVTPSNGVDVIGYEGGPFTPTSATYTLTNPLESTLIWTASVTAPWLTLSAENGSLEPLASAELIVTLNAAALPPGTYADVLTITPDGFGSSYRDVSLTVFPIPGEIAVTDSIAPDNDSDMPFVEAVLTLTYTEQVTITNVDDTYDLTVNGISLESVVFSLEATGFTLTNFPTLPFTLAPGNTVTFDVVYSPIDEGFYEDTIIITSNDMLLPEITVALSADAILDPLRVSPDTPYTAQGLQGGPFVAADNTYTLTNASVSPLTWTANAPEWLTLTSDGGILGAGSSTEVIVSVNAAAEALPPGYYEGTLIFTNGNTALTVVRDVSLLVASSTSDATVTDSILPADDLAMPFDAVVSGNSRTEVITVHNNDPSANLIIENIVLDSELYYETFNDGLAQGWMPADASHWAVTANLYTAYTAYAPLYDGYMQSTYPGNWGDATLEATVQQDTSSNYSMLFMRTSDDFMMLMRGSGIVLLVLNRGEYFVLQQDLNQGVINDYFGFSDDILPAPNANRVSMTMKGSTLQVSFNGGVPQVLSFNNVPESGGIGIGGYTKPSAPTMYLFDDIRVFQETPFRLDNLPLFPHELAPGEYLSVETIFAPRTRGCHSDIARVFTNDLYEPVIEVALTGCLENARRYVKTTGSDENDGLSWDTAKATLQVALEDAVAGDDIWVARGTYYPTSRNNITYLDGKRLQHFLMKSGVYLYGGFAGTETDVEQRDLNANSTRLSGDIGIPGNITDNCYHVIYTDAQEAVAQAGIDGFVISDGYASGYDYDLDRGAGIYGRFDGFTVANCIFEDNIAQRDGGGAYIRGDNNILLNCMFIENTSVATGGGLHIVGDNLLLRDCSFIENYCENNSGYYYYSDISTGGGAHIGGDGNTVIGCIFEDNYIYLQDYYYSGMGAFGGGASATGEDFTMADCSFDRNWIWISSNSNSVGIGGALALEIEGGVINNCTFTSNSASSQYTYHAGGGAVFWVGPEFTISNCVFWDNYEGAISNMAMLSSYTNASLDIINSTFYGNHTQSSTGIINTTGDLTTVNIQNCVLWNEGAIEISANDAQVTASYSNVQGGYEGIGNIDANPLFLNGAGGDFRLQSESPCINAGNPEGVPPAPPRDIMGTLRPQSDRVDMGAYEYDATTPQAEIYLLSPPQTSADEIEFSVQFSEPLASPLNSSNLEFEGSLRGLLTISGVYSDYRVTLVPDDPDEDGTAGILLRTDSVMDPAGNPAPGASSPLCEVFNWHGFVEEPQGVRLYQGDFHILSALANCGAANLLYQWKWEDETKAIHDGPQTASWKLETVTPSMRGAYWCEVFYDGLTHPTPAAVVAIEPQLEVVQAPESGMAYEGDGYLFSVEVTGGYAPLAYRWEKNGLYISDAPTVLLENLTLEDSGLYTVIVNDDNTAQLVFEALLTVLPNAMEGEGEIDPCNPDLTPPVVTLAGDTEVILESCALYEEYGLASALDYCDGDLVYLLAPTDVWVNIWVAAASVYTNTTLDSVGRVFNTLYGTTSGEYTLVYNVADTSGNETLTERYVTVDCEPTEGEGEVIEGEGEVVEGEGEVIEGEGEVIEGEGEVIEGEGEVIEGEGEVIEGEGEVIEGEGEVIEGEGEVIEGEGEVIEGEGEVIEGEGEVVEGEGEVVEGEGEVVEGEGEVVEGEGEVVEGEGEVVEGEGEVVEGEGETDVDDIADTLFEEFDNADLNDDGLLDFTEVQNIIEGLTQEQFNALDTDGDGLLGLVELAQFLGEQCVPVLTAVDADIDCTDYAAAQDTVTAAFESVHAEDGCGTVLTDAVRIRRITRVYNRHIEQLDLEAIAEKSRGFEDNPYDYSINATRKLFHLYLLFHPGHYAIEYVTQGENGVLLDNYESTKTQRIVIDDACKGCLGCNQNCAGCRARHIPESINDLKRLISDLLLIGIAVLTAFSWTALNRR